MMRKVGLLPHGVGHGALTQGSRVADQLQLRGFKDSSLSVFATKVKPFMATLIYFVALRPQAFQPRQRITARESVITYRGLYNVIGSQAG